ncbi:MAG TPA: hypothetical protein VKA67_12910 [Verrucomicrobiae bacterium]|nr:hypothetical protein [Verrucomicrobiae bacterium]
MIRTVAVALRESAETTFFASAKVEVSGTSTSWPRISPPGNVAV